MVTVVDGKKVFSAPFLFDVRFMDLTTAEKDEYADQAYAWFRENGVDPDDAAAVKAFLAPFREKYAEWPEWMTKPRVEPPPVEDESMFRPPFNFNRDYRRLCVSDQAKYMKALFAWLDDPSTGSQRPPKDFSVVTAENFTDMIDDFRDEITPEDREALKQAVLAGKVPGYVDETGCMHLGMEAQAQHAREHS